MSLSTLKWGCCTNEEAEEHEQLINCIRCNKSYHFLCLSLPEIPADSDVYRQWKCPVCMILTSKTRTKDCTPVRNTSVSTTRGSKRQALNSPPESSAVTAEDVRSIEQSVIETEFATLLKQLNNTLVSTLNKELEPLKTDIEELKTSFTFHTKEFDELKSEHVIVKSNIINLKEENQQLNNTVSELRQKLNYLEQHARSNNLEIQCLPENAKENLYTVVKQLGSVVGCELKDGDILHATRTAKLNKSIARPRSVVVQLASPRTRDQTTVCEDCQRNKTSYAQVSQSPQLTIDPTEASGEKVLREVNKKLEVLHGVEKKLGELTSAVEFYAEMYQTLLEYKEESQKKIKALEQKNIYLEKYNMALEERVQELELKDKENEIEIHGLEARQSEDIKSVVQDVAQILNLNPEDIEDAMRVGQKKPHESKPKVVVVTLRSKCTRKTWMMAKKGKKITNDKVFRNGNNDQIYINEALPKFKRQLLWTVRKKLKPKGYQYIWVQNGSILVKKNSEEKRIFNVRTEKDLEIFVEMQNSE
ncbi:unnamed protein product [Arctia plantaginis]|uniref:PHD-type domain-containing protein n=1 Tax=Arctia plantaginis TaxID=874455 RepID=A0A8S1BB22_ARCPL|nr:unnamed protein product [Arctia plantaginis]